MNRAFFSPILFLTALFLFSCHRNPDRIASGEMPPAGQTIIPDSGQDTADRGDRSLIRREEENRNSLVPSLPIEARWKVVQLVDTNLDGDSDDEQIIILEPQNTAGGEGLEVWIADYNTSSSSHMLAWKGELSSRSGDKLTITVNEAASPGEYEMYVLGYDDRDYHTLDVFYPQSDQSPSYRNIFTQSVKGTIELYFPQTAGASLSDDYGTRVKVSPDIVITRADPDSANTLDSVITTWQLSYNPVRYKLVSTRKVKAAKGQEEKLLELISSPVEDFEEILSDYWYKEEGESGLIRMVNLNLETRELEFLTLQNYESYLWDSSHKSSYAPRLYIYGTSKYISSIRKELTVNLIDIDSINLDITDNGTQHHNSAWSGNYKRMTEGMKSSLIKTFVREINTQDFALKGKYKSASGEEFSFDQTDFTLREGNNDRLRQGRFSLFLLNGKQLMELVYYDGRGMTTDRETYLFSHNVVDDQDHRIRSFHITAGETDTHGFVISEVGGKQFEQIELLSD